MPKYYCDYCDIFLTHDSPSVRKSHNEGWKHKGAVKNYYGQFEENHTQTLIDQKIKAFEQQKKLGLLPPNYYPPGFPGAGNQTQTPPPPPPHFYQYQPPPGGVPPQMGGPPPMSGVPPMGGAPQMGGVPPMGVPPMNPAPIM